MQLTQQLQAIHARHADVADHHARPIPRQARGEACGFAQGQYFQPGQVQGLAQGLTQVWIVVDQHHLNLVIDTHTLRSSDGCRLTPGAPARNFKVNSAPLSLWLANSSSPPKARIRVSQIARPNPRPWVRVLVV